MAENTNNNNSTAKASFIINPSGDSINNSTYRSGSFVIKNNSTNGEKIEKVTIDLSTSIFPDLVFDPNGVAGDPVGKGFTPDSLGGTGLVKGNFIKLHDDGYDALEIYFNDFDPGETFTFSADVDPTSVRGLPQPGPKDSGSVSGLELIGTEVTVDFDNNATYTGQTYRLPGTKDGSQAVVKSNLPPKLAVEILGLSPLPAVISELNQTVRISGTPGEEVALLAIEAGLFLDDYDGFDIDPFEANSAIRVEEKSATIGANGYVDIAIALKDSLKDSKNNGGINHLVAVAKDSQGNTGLLSDVQIVDIQSGSTPPPPEPTPEPEPTPIPEPTPEPTPEPEPTSNVIRINAGGKAYTDVNGNLWSADQYFTGGRTYSSKANISDTEDDKLYQTERWTKNLSYIVPVTNGDYKVTVKFAELYWNSADKRSFDLSAEGKLVLDDLDIFTEAGKNTALDKSFNITVSDGKLNLDFLTNSDNAKLAAIEIVGDSTSIPEPTPEPEPTPTPEPEPTPEPTPTPTTNIIRINAGGKAYTDINGNLWEADNYFTGGRTYSSKADIANTEDDKLYQTERWTKNLSYVVPVSNGDYTVNVKFAEIYWNEADKRSFDLSAEGKLVLDDFDIFAEAQKNTALDKSFDLTVSDGSLNLDFLSNFDNAKLAGIEIIGSSSPTPEPIPPKSTTPPNPDSDIRINAGGNAYTDTAGNLWSTDRYFDGGNKSSTKADIFKTEEDKLYQTERWAKNLGYDIPVNDGNYRVNLHFAENYFDDFNKRIFDVSVEGEKVVDDLDIFAKSKNAFFPGKDSAYIYSVDDVNITDGFLNLDFNADVDNAKISAIEIVSLTGAQVIFKQTDGNTSVVEGTTGDSYSIILNSKPSADVTVNLDSNSQINTSRNSVTFTPENWNVPQNITVHAVDDDLADGNQTVNITHTIDSSDSDYNSLKLPKIAVSVGDDDTVAIAFTKKTVATISKPTAAAWGPDGRLYVGSYSGEIKAYTFDDNYNVSDTQTITTLKKASNKNILGIAFNPYDTSDSPSIYVSHNKLYANGGSDFPETELSPYSGQISILEGADFSTVTPLVTGLPVSNHDHGVNSITFDNEGNLYVAVGGNTNAGIPADKIGGIPESPFAAAILKAEITKPDFNGEIKYELPAGFVPPQGLTFDPAQSQVFGNIAKVADGVDVSVYASGLRNSFDLVWTTKGLMYATDNGPNGGFGDVSTSATTQKPVKNAPDELNLIVEDGYYGHPNRNRGQEDSRQNVYYSHKDSTVPGVYTEPLTTFSASTNGIDEYRANTFGGQMRGNLITQKWNGESFNVTLSPDGTQVVNQETLDAQSKALDILTGPGGAIVGINLGGSKINVSTPDDVTVNGATAYDIFPWRAPATGGNLFIIGGDEFGDLNNTEVTIGDEIATLTEVSDNRIMGILPSFDRVSGDLLDISVTSEGQTSLIADAFLPLTGSANFV